MKLTLTCLILNRRKVIKIVEQALKAGKHVLVDDPVSSSVSTYNELIQLAHAQQRHLQETTMFLYHHGLKDFFTYTLNDSTFGTIRHVHLDLDFAEESFGHSCLSDLTRYASLLGILLFRKINRKPLSARVIKLHRQNGVCICSCDCQVQMEDVSY
jgi:hypothetical protein